MSKTDFAVLLCRFIGLYFLINAIYGLGNPVIMLVMPLLIGGTSMFTKQLVLNIAIPQLFGFLIGLVVWRKAPSIGKKMAT